MATRIHYTCVMHIEWSDDTCGDECARLTHEWNTQTYWHDDPANWQTFGDLPDDHGTMGF